MAISKEVLELQAEKLEGALREFGVSASVVGGAILPQVIVYELRLGPGQQIAGVRKIRDELALRLSVPGVLISRVDGAVHVQVPRSSPQVISFGWMLSIIADDPPPQTALLGMGYGGAPLLAHFPSPNVAHMLIAGMTGAGKSELLQTIVASLSLWSGSLAAVYLIDPKERLAGLGRLRPVMQICGAEAAPALLLHLVEEMERRGARGGRRHVYLIIDELADLVMVDRSVEVALTRLVQRGREAAIHVIAATQRPSARVIAGLMKANFPVRISGAVASAAEASIATGMPQTGAELLLGKGDMILIFQGRPERFQVCMLAEEDWDLVAEQAEGLTVVKSAALAPVSRVLDMTERLRAKLGVTGPGRPEKGFTEEMVDFALGQIAATGVCSQRALRRWHQEAYGTDANPPRVAAAIQEALRRFDGQR